MPEVHATVVTEAAHRETTDAIAIARVSIFDLIHPLLIIIIFG